MVKLPPDQGVSGLSDDDLFQRLKDFGVDVGPIVGSTRILYERKLQRLLTGEEPATQDFEEDSEEDANEYALNDNAYRDSPRPEAYNVRYQQPIATAISSSGEEYRNSESYIRSRPGLSSTPLQPSALLRQEMPVKNNDSEINSFGLVIKLAIVSFIAAFLLFIVYSNMENDESNPVPSV